MKQYNKYLIKEQESKNNLLENVLDLENEWNEENKQDNFYISIDTQWIEEERKVFPIAFYLGDINAQYDNEYECFTLDCIERLLVGTDKEIVDLLKEDLKEYDLLENKKITQKTILIYKYRDNFQVEIEENEFIEFWLYNADYGIKMFMFGIQCEREEYIELIENSIEENIEIYRNEYMED